MLADAPPPVTVRPLNCPACGGTIALRAAGYSVSLACEYCGSIVDVADPAAKLIHTHHEKAAELEIPLGTRAVLYGTEWEAIGYLRRSLRGAYPWHEYLLFNPYHGYRWLVSDGRGWSFGEMLTETPSYNGYNQYGVAGQAFTRFFSESEVRVDRVVGEFYWRVKVGERVRGADWVRPGWMLSREVNDREVSWTLLRLVEPKVMREAFGIEVDANPWPPLPHQRSAWGDWLRQAWPVAPVAIGLIALAALFLGTSSKVGSGGFPIADRSIEQTGTLGPIMLPSPYQRVDITAVVPKLENGWVDMDFALVDRATQKSYEAYGAAERYSGSDSDGPWTEGAREVSLSVSGVPAGTYDLVVDYQPNRWTGAGSSLYPEASWMERSGEPTLWVDVRRGGAFFSSFLIAAVLILLPLLWGFFRHLRFEQERQMQSDYDPIGLAALFKSSEA